MSCGVIGAAIRDRDVVELLKAGDRDRAFAKLLQRYEGKIYRLCCALLRDPTLAEDAAQESVVRVWKALESYNGRASLSSWIYAITRNRCLSALEKRRGVEALTDGEFEARLEKFAVPTGERGDDRSEQLRELVGHLPQRLRRVLVLYYFEDRSIEEVADMLGCPRGTVKTHLFRARAALTQELKRRGLHDPGLWLGGAS